MSKCDDPVKSVKDDRGVDHFVIIQLSKIFYLSNSLLVKFEVVVL